MFAGRELRNMVDELLWVPLKISWRWLLQDLFCCVALLPCCKIFLLCCLVALVIVVAVFFFVIFASVVVVIIYPDRNPCCHCCRSCFSCCCHFVYSYTTAFVSFWISSGDSWAAAREAPGNPDLWKLSRARNLYRRDPGGLHHRPGWPDKGDLRYHASILPMLLFSRLLLLSIKRYFSGLWPTPLYQRHRCKALQDLPSVRLNQGEHLSCRVVWWLTFLMNICHVSLFSNSLFSYSFDLIKVNICQVELFFLFDLIKVNICHVML